MLWSTGVPFGWDRGAPFGPVWSLTAPPLLVPVPSAAVSAVAANRQRLPGFLVRNVK